MGRLISPVYRISSVEVRLATIALFLFAFYKSRIWDKAKLDEVITFAKLQYKIFMKNIKEIHAASPSRPASLQSELASQPVPAQI